MRVSLTLFGFPFDWYVPLTQAAEAAGFEAAWVSDHVVTPASFERAYPYNESGSPGYTLDTPLADVWPLLGAMAARTSRIRLGTGVLILPLRNPFLAAHAACTVQELSDGRFLFGFGGGWMREEFEALEEPWPGRGARTDEMLEVMRKLWSGETVAHRGRFYSFEPVRHPPAPRRPIPLLGCGLSDGALRRSATVDGWFGPAVPLATSMEAVDRLHRLRVAAAVTGRFEAFVRLEGRFEPADLERHERAGVEHLVIGLGALGIQPGDGLLARVEAVRRASSLLGGAVMRGSAAGS